MSVDASNAGRLERLARRLDAIVEIGGRIGAWCGFALLVVMAGNVLMRYALRTGSVAMQELEWHLMAPVSLLCIAYAIKHEGHIRVDIFYVRMSLRARQIVDLVSCLCALALCVLIVHLSIPYVMQAWDIGEGSPNPGGLPHRWILKSTIPLGFVLLGLQSLASVLRAWAPFLGVGRLRIAVGSSLMPFTEVLAILSIVSFFVLLAVGVPVALTLAISGFVFGYIGFGPLLFSLLPARIFGVTANYTLIAIPLFVFMGVMLEKSKIANELMDVIGHISGNLRGGMAIGIVVVGVLMGATTGIVGATIVTLGLLTLPALLRRGYDKSLACGTICASGTLGQLIPPSTILILLADIMGQSVGTLFAAALLPGLLLSGIFCVYLLLLGVLKPHMAPPVPLEERLGQSGRDTFVKFLKVGFPPIALVLCVLGSIIGGIAAPTEAASMGALSSIVVTALLGRLNWRTLVDTVYATGRITAAMMFVLICAQVFALAFRGLNGERLVHDAFAMVPGGSDGLVIFMLLLIFVLGFFIEWIEISYIVVPLFIPLLNAANVDPVWTATLIAVVLQTSFLTPPFGWALFYLRGVAPPQVSTVDIYKGVVPFILLQAGATAVVFVFPGVATWLPKAIGW